MSGAKHSVHLYLCSTVQRHSHAVCSVLFVHVEWKTQKERLRCKRCREIQFQKKVYVSK